jgi:hypothetical protein
MERQAHPPKDNQAPKEQKLNKTWNLIFESAVSLRLQKLKIRFQLILVD